MFLLISSMVTIVILILLIIRRKKVLVYFLLTILSLDLFLFFVFVYFAKRGGISGSLNQFFYLNENIRIHLRNMILTLPQLGYWMSIGRFLFPSLVLFLSLLITYPNSRSLSRYGCYLFLPTLVSLIFYFPVVFKQLTYVMQSLVMWFSLIWVVVYSLLAFGIFMIDLFLIRPGWSQIKYFAVNFFACFLILVYLLYCTQDGAQVYNFYSYNLPWTLGLSYMHLMSYEHIYGYILALYGVFSIGGMISLYLYLSDIVEMNREEIVLSNKSQTALPATHIFVHGLKNKLLVEQAYIKKIQRNLEISASSSLQEEVKKLYESNQATLSHLDELYRSFKNDHISLQKWRIAELLEESSQMFYKKYPEAPPIQITLTKDAFIMADRHLLSEAFSNLLINGYESMYQLPESARKVSIEVKSGIFNVILSFHDGGVGLSDKEKKSIYYPFTSSKNSSENWGMGLFFTKKVIKQHSGKIYIDTQQGKGSTFRVMLPKRRGGK